MAKREADASPGPRFFRVMLPGFSEKMPIPRHFVKHVISKEKCRAIEATLMSPSGEAWHVNVNKGREQHTMYFGGEGFKAFAQAHSLELGHFLVFHYKGNMVFSFRVYSLSTCEIASYPSLKITQLPKPISGKRRMCKDKKTSERESSFRVIVTDYNLCASDVTIPCRLRDAVSKALMRNKISIVDPEGRSWPVVMRYRSRAADTQQRIRMGKGWLEFAHGNNLEKGDDCIFKLGSKGREEVLLVQIHKCMTK